MPASYPRDFRDGALRVGRNCKPTQNNSQIAEDFGISGFCLKNRKRQTDVEDGFLPGKIRRSPAAAIARTCWRKTGRACSTEYPSVRISAMNARISGFGGRALSRRTLRPDAKSRCPRGVARSPP